MSENSQINGLEEKYLQYTAYHLFPGGRKRLRIIIKYCEQRSLRLGRRLRVLDVGCGNGAISLPVASLDHSLLGIDISPESVEFASHRNPFPNARFMVHNLMEKLLPEKFDLVICSEVLEHLPEPELTRAGHGRSPGTRRSDGDNCSKRLWSPRGVRPIGTPIKTKPGL